MEEKNSEVHLELHLEEESREQVKMAMRMITSQQQELKAKMIMMSVILRRKQARRKEGMSPSAWAVKSFDSISSLITKVILFILKDRSY